MPNENAASGSARDNAGDDGFAKAFEAATQKVDLSGAEFAPGPMDPVQEPVETENDEPAAEAEPKASPDIKAEAAPAKAVEPASDIKAPAHWPAAQREAFAALPPDARKSTLDFVKGFEADYTRKSTELAEDKKFSQSVRSLITNDHRAQMRRAGLSDEQGIAHLVSLNDLYTRDPAGYVRMVVERSGLTPQQVFPQFTGDGATQGQQPAQADSYQQLYGYLQTVHGELEGIKREREQATLRTVNRSIERFAQDKDAEGKQKHPHFDQVQGKMVQLLSTPDYIAIEDYGERLQAAYDAAVYLDPTIKSQIVDSEVQKRLREERQKQDVEKARKAKAPVKAAPVASGKQKPGNLNDAARQAMNMLGVS